MPMHDWTRVDPNDFHDFHVVWLGTMRTALNTGVLPPGYIALAEHATPPFVPDVVTMQYEDDSDEPDGPSAAWGGAAVAVGRATSRAKVAPVESPAGRVVAIRHARGRELVAVIELVSPSNKAAANEYQALLRKSVEFVKHRVSVLVIDPYPPGPHDPHGFHTAFWSALTQRRAGRPPQNKPLTVASYAPDGKGACAAYVTPLAVSDSLPSPPLFLRPDLAVRVPLEASYDAAWVGYPAPLKRRVAAGLPSPPQGGDRVQPGGPAGRVPRRQGGRQHREADGGQQ